MLETGRLARLEELSKRTQDEVAVDKLSRVWGFGRRTAEGKKELAAISFSGELTRSAVDEVSGEEWRSGRRLPSCGQSGMEAMKTVVSTACGGWRDGQTGMEAMERVMF